MGLYHACRESEGAAPCSEQSTQLGAVAIAGGSGPGDGEADMDAGHHQKRILPPGPPARYDRQNPVAVL